MNTRYLRHAPAVSRAGLVRTVSVVLVAVLLTGIGMGSLGLAGIATTATVQPVSVAEADVDELGEMTWEDVDCAPADCGSSDGSAPAAGTSGPTLTEGFHALPTVTPESAIVLATYSRWNGVSPLDHELRNELYEIIDRAPGVAMPDVIERANDSRSTVRYHVGILQHENLIQTATVWGLLRLYPRSIGDDEYERFAAIHDSALSPVLVAIVRNPGSSVSTLAEDLDRAPSTVSHHLSRLDEANLITRERDGQCVVVDVTSETEQLLEFEWQRAPPESDQSGIVNPADD